MADLPLSLQLLLTQEAYLLRSKERLAAGTRGLQERIDELKHKEKRFGLKFKFKDSGKDSRHQELVELQEAVAVIRNGNEYADKLLSGIQPKVESELEDLLRLTSSEYRQGLAAQRFQSDIVRCLRRFRDRVAELRKAVGISRNSMAAAYRPEQKTYRESALLDLEIAAKCGNALESEIDFFNEVAEQHDKHVENTTFENIALPRLREFPYETWIRTQAEFPAQDLKENFDKILSECDQLLQSEIGEMFTRIQKASDERKQASVSFVHNYWKILRDYACKTWVKEEKLDAFIENLEQGMMNMSVQ